MLHKNPDSLSCREVTYWERLRNWAGKNAVLMAHGIGHRLGQSSAKRPKCVKSARSHEEELGRPKTMMKGKIETL